MKKLSVIVPVYNVAPYLRHCLQSLTEQGVEDMEVLLIDDGSYDNSRGICLEWCADHPQFRLIIHETNKGLSETRNTGIREAEGEFIAFVDSDDYLAPNTLGQCLQEAEDADVVEFPVRRDHLSNHASTWTPQEQTLSFREWMQGDGYTHCYACNKIFRRSLWGQTTFPPGKYYEDIFTIPYVLRQSHRIKGVSHGLYYYCNRHGSISRTPKPQALKDYVEALVELNKLPENEHNTALYIRSLNAEISYRKYSHQKEKLVPRRNIPWSYLFTPSLSKRERAKATWLKICNLWK